MNQDKSLLEETKPWQTKIEKSAADLDEQIQTPKKTNCKKFAEDRIFDFSKTVS